MLNILQLADRLIGIYKTDNATKTVTINPTLVAGGRQRQLLALSIKLSNTPVFSVTNCLHFTNQQNIMHHTRTSLGCDRGKGHA